MPEPGTLMLLALGGLALLRRRGSFTALIRDTHNREFRGQDT
jgi:hypothetical protein